MQFIVDAQVLWPIAPNNIKVQLVIDLVYSIISVYVQHYSNLGKSGDWNVDSAVMMVGAVGCYCNVKL